MNERTLTCLSAKDVREALPMAAAVEAMKGAFKDLSSGAAVVPPRTHVMTEDPKGDALFMPSYGPSVKKMGLKVVTLYEGNRSKGLPFIQAIVLILDATNGSPVAILDGTTVTAIRTGAASGAATDFLARRDAKVAAIFGAGAQARTQLEAVCSVRAIEEAWVTDVHEEYAALFAREMGEYLNITVHLASCSDEALANADIVCAATTSETPVFADSELKPGVHINAVGSYKPHVREVPPETVCRAKVVVDQREAAWEEAGDLILPLNDGLIAKEHVYAEVGELVLQMKPGRENDTEVTFFKSVGVAIQDLAAACKALENAEKLGLGQKVVL